MTREKNPTILLQLATHYSKIEQKLKMVNHNQLVQDQIAEQNAMQKNNEIANQNNIMSLLPATSIATVLANSNLMSRIVRIF